MTAPQDTSLHLLLVEDDASLGEFLGRVFLEEGISFQLATSLADARRRLAQRTFDAIVLDWMLPDGDGLLLCEELSRQTTSPPVLMLTARGEVADRVRGLRSGADDYLTKPFSVEELLARLEALLRRVRGELRLGSLLISRMNQRVLLDGSPVELTSKELALLLRLAQTPDQTVERSTLYVDVWGLKFDPGSGVLDVHISRLRDKLGPEAWRVETLRAVGYRLRSTR
ncbi:MAG: response regulator transcription factor [Polyangiaceae bacterium]|jgi:DNA-binding response OmpR family regulator|nr:response regulator transcription factor [Polyangiaceae bacterium]